MQQGFRLILIASNRHTNDHTSLWTDNSLNVMPSFWLAKGPSLCSTFATDGDLRPITNKAGFQIYASEWLIVQERHLESSISLKTFLRQH